MGMFQGQLTIWVKIQTMTWFTLTMERNSKKRCQKILHWQGYWAILDHPKVSTRSQDSEPKDLQLCYYDIDPTL